MAALRSPLVGRARELNQLNGLLDETLETATPHFALVYGPAGIGKSRLIVEFLAAARARSELNVLTGRCRATGELRLTTLSGWRRPPSISTAAARNRSLPSGYRTG